MYFPYDINFLAEVLLKVNVDVVEANAMFSISRKANTIHQSIKVTIEYPKKHSYYKLQILDTELQLETKFRRVQILHSHYAMPMSYQYLVHKNAAISNSAKVNIFIVTLLRVMTNVSCICVLRELERHT